jgi:hypothetical protein
MSLAVTVTKQWFDGKKIHVVGSIVASSTYATGGDALSFASLGIKSSQAPFWVKFNSLNGYSYVYSPNATPTQANGLMRVNTTANTELTAAAYPAGVTGDTIGFYALFEIR